MDADTYKKVVTKQSSCFKILSKPEVHANQNSKVSKPVPSKKRKETITPTSNSSSSNSTENSTKKRRKQNQFFNDTPPPDDDSNNGEDPNNTGGDSLMYDASMSSYANSIPFPFLLSQNNNSYDESSHTDHHLYALLDDDGKTISLSQPSISLSQSNNLVSLSSGILSLSQQQQQQQPNVNIMWPASPNAAIQFLGSQPLNETSSTILPPSTPTNPPLSLSQPFSPTKMFGSSQDFKPPGPSLVTISFSQDQLMPLQPASRVNSPPSSQLSNSSTACLSLSQLRTQQDFVEIFDKRERNVGMIVVNNNTTSSSAKSSTVLSQEI